MAYFSNPSSSTFILNSLYRSSAQPWVSRGAPSHFYEALRIRNAALDQVIHSRHDVQVRLIEIMAHHIAQKCVSISGGSAVVRLQHCVAFGGEHRLVLAPGAKHQLIR